MVEIKIRKNGPILIRGKVKIEGVDGEEIVLTRDTFALCRCGGSVNKPFCDGAHKVCGFTPDD